MKYIIDGENPEQKLILEPLKTEEGLPAFCKENLITHEETYEFSGDAFDIGTMFFYEMMYNTITKGIEMEIKPEHAVMILSSILIHTKKS